MDQVKRILLLLLAALAFGVILHLTGEEVKIVWLRYVPTVGGILIIPITLFDLWLWKVSETLVRRPRLYGTWRGVIHSEWKNPRTGQNPDPIECYVAITQTYSTIVIRQFTEESKSKTVTARIITDDDIYVVDATYVNEPDLQHQDRSRMHYGAMRLDVKRGAHRALSGTYWTDRGSYGKLELLERNKNIVDGFERAKQLFAEC